MKPIIIYNRILPFGSYVAITLFPFIFIRKEYKPVSKETIAHESIHVQQQLELLLIFFYIWYGIEYLINLAKYRNHSMAYYNISFEKEAYSNQRSASYLEERKRFNFIKYIKDHD